MYNKVMINFVCRIASVISIAMIMSFCVNAEELKEMLFLKDGNIIRGTIIELIPEGRVKIQTADGSIFVYQMTDVDRISKELSPTVKEDKEYGYEQSLRYRGFFNPSLVIGLGKDNYFRSEISTTHGIQIIPEVFVGVGVGVMFWETYSYNYYDSLSEYAELTSIPVFACARGELHNIIHRNFSPYFDIKVGYNFKNFEGVFFTPEVGMHFYFGHYKTGLGFGLGYHLQSAKIQSPHIIFGNEGYDTVWLSSREILSGLSLNIAFDF